jgi:arginine decarboxylase
MPTKTVSAEPGSAWSPRASAELYRVEDWSEGYFRVNDAGHLSVLVDTTTRRELDLHEIVEGLRARDLPPPVALHFVDILDHRLRRIFSAFDSAIEENNYQGRYRAVYPIKVNQQRPTVEAIFRSGSQYDFGLEVGSKPELMASLAVSTSSPDRLLICNGFKDKGYIEAAMLATKLGRNIIPVIENRRELRMILEFAERHGVRPQIGVRVKLSSRSLSRWGDSVGSKAKFGLTLSEVVEVFEELQRNDMEDCLKLVHCHAGSQIQDIQYIKGAVGELSQVYCELAELGAGLEYIDVGGGFGVDYDGSQSDSPSSINYALEEYASQVVYRIASACDSRNLPHPTIVTESGRALATYQSVLVVEVIGKSDPTVLGRTLDLSTIDRDAISEHQPLADMLEALESIAPDRIAECYHDAVEARSQVMQLFSVGYIDLHWAAVAEKMFQAICLELISCSSDMDDMPEEIATIRRTLDMVYFCNFSLFQSLPDVWAIDQVFPLMPIHRLDERPSRTAILGDLTCDSDGKIDKFIGTEGVESALHVHELEEGEPYYLGVFLVGAYQDTLGDFHNLFGDHHVVHIRAGEAGSWRIEDYVEGDSTQDVLSYVRFDPKAILRALTDDCESAVADGRISLEEGRALRRFYRTELQGYTYLD